MKKILAMLLALLLVGSMCACSDDPTDNNDWDEDFQQNDEVVDHVAVGNAYNEVFYFEAVDTETVTITGYQASDAPHVMKIPETLDGKTVVSISDKAFYFCSKINGVEFPATLTTIGKEAFAGCSLISSLTVPATITSIGENAFFGCTALETLTFAAGCAADIGDTAFMDCTALKSVTIPGTIKTVSAGTFFACTALESVVIEEGVELIGSQAFQNCTKLASLSLPASVASIGSYAFSGSDALYAGAATAPAGSVAAEYIKNLNLPEAPSEDTN
jgi:hypothetical protein